MSNVGLLVVLFSVTAFGRQAFQGSCTKGGQVAITSGISSTTKILASYPGCTVSVFNHGLATLATIFDDNGVSLANPFTASVLNGVWLFTAANGHYDVVLSGGTPSFPTPETITDILLNDPTASNTVTATAFISASANPATSGVLQVASADTLACWKSNLGGPDLCFTKNSSDVVDLNTALTIHGPFSTTGNPITASTITGTTGTFSGAITGASYSGGPVAGTTGTFSGAVSGQAISGTTGTFSGAITGSSVDNTPIGLNTPSTGTFTNVNGIRLANAFPGSGATQINNAENDCGTTNCLVFVPATVAAGSAQSLLTKDNVMVMDLRTGSPPAQGTQWRLNVKDTDDGAVRAKMLLLDPVQPSSVMQSGSSSVSFEALSFIEGNMNSRNVMEAINGTEIVDTGTTGSPNNIIGGEFAAIIQGTAANTILDARGSTHSCTLTGAGNVTTCTSLYAQKPTSTSSGTTANAYSIHAEAPTAGTVNNLSILADGNTSTNALFVPYSGVNGASGVVIGTNTIQPGVALFVRPGIFSFMTGGTQAGAQIAPVTNSDATTAGIGLRARADTVAAVFVQPLNQGLRVDTPSIGAGSSLTEWDGLDVEAAPAAGTKCSIKLAGSTSGTTCINPSAVASGTITIPAATGTIALVSGTGTFSCANVTPVTVSANVTTDQILMACTIPAGTLNTAAKTLSIQGAGVYSTPAGSTSTVNVKIKLCTVSGCGSGTVITLASVTSAALGAIQATNDPFNFQLFSSTQTTGASAAFEAHGNLTIDISALTTAAEAVYADGNTATVGTIDSTAQLFLQITGAFSAGSASNSITQRQLTAESVN